jgi:hypothetical protein
MQRLPALFLPLLLVGTAVAASAAPTARGRARSTPRTAKPQTAAPAIAADPEVSRILEAHSAAKPTDGELSLFKLDWAGSLKEAKERAAKEGRPIFFVSTTQLEDAGDLRGGHC